MMGKSQAKNNMKKTRKHEFSHLEARRDDDSVGDEEQRKNKQEKQNGSSKNNNGALGFEWAEGRR